jgi:Galactose oxidase, central domain/Kelch motif
MLISVFICLLVLVAFAADANVVWEKLLSDDASAAAPDPTLGAAGCLIDDRLLVYGGCSSSCCYSPLDTLWLYDLNTLQWQQLTPHGRRPTARFAATAAPISSGQMLLYGGMDAVQGPQSDVWLYDVESNEWTEVYVDSSSSSYSGLPPARSSHAAALLDTAASQQKQLLVYGGAFKAGIVLSDVWLLSLDDYMSHTRWTRVVLTNASESAPARTGATITAVASSSSDSSVQLLMFGGADASGAVSNELWVLEVSIQDSTASGTWQLQSTSGDKPAPRL